MAKNPTAVAALLKSPLTFMRSNFVRVNFVDTRGLHSFTLDDSLGAAQLPDGTLIPGHYLVAGDGGSGCFTAYWCPYAPSELHSVIVGPAADLMFTANMSGCSLGVGSRTQTGHRLVSHANCMRTFDVIYDSLVARGTQHAVALLIARSHQQYTQRLALQFRMRNDAGMTTIEPPTYRRDDLEPREVLESTTFGVRDSDANDWAFYVQKQDVSQFNPVLVAVAFAGGAEPEEKHSYCIMM